MGYITSVLGLQARSRRNARNASRALSLRRSVAESSEKAVAAARHDLENDPQLP